MTYGKDVFMKFCARVTLEFGLLSTNKELAKLASYFWEKLDERYKTEWKQSAADHNYMNGLRGKRKRRGFWHFALALENQVSKYDVKIFHDIWQNLKTDERMFWLFSADSLVDYEIKCIRL